MRIFLQTLMAALREIFDESAYQRFLARQGCEASRGSYELFLEESKTARLKKPRCC